MDKPNKKNKKKESAFYDDEMLENMLKDSMPKRYGKEEENPFDVYLRERQKEQASIAKQTEVAEATVDTEIVEETKVTEVNNTTEVIEVTEVENQAEPVREKTVAKELSPPKATRISAKMRRASREEFCDTYLKKCDTKFGKPITIEAPLMPRLYRICLLSGDRKAGPTTFINNMIKEILPTLEKDAERW